MFNPVDIDLQHTLVARLLIYTTFKVSKLTHTNIGLDT
jgi:hypothetical protein